MNRYKFLICIFIFYCNPMFSQIEYVEQAAESGDLESQVFLVKTYLKGSASVDKNIAKAYKWCLAAAEQGHVGAMYNLSSADELASFVEQSDRNQKYWAQRAADNGHYFAMWTVADNYLEEKNDLAYYYYNKLSRSDINMNVMGKIGIAECTAFGIGVSKNIPISLELFDSLRSFLSQKIEKDGELIAYDNAFRSCIWKEYTICESHKMPRKMLEILDNYDCVTKSNNTCKLRSWLYMSIGDYVNAKKNFEEIIESNDTEGFLGLAYLFLGGLGVNQDLDKAKVYLDKVDETCKKERFLDCSGEYYIRTNNMSKALQIWKKLISEFPEHINSDSYFVRQIKLLVHTFKNEDDSKLFIETFFCDEMDLTANISSGIVYDQNGDKCALIKIISTLYDLAFDVGMLGVSKVIRKNGELFVYVPHGVKKITISHPKYGKVMNFYFPQSIEEAKTYTIILKHLEK